jgi:hypothetical protein
VVGYTFTADEAASHVFLYSGGTMTDLNSLLPAGSGWVLLTPTAINDFGQIVGYGNINGEQHAFLLNTIDSVPITVQTNVAGLLISVDGGVAQTSPFTTNLVPGPHNISVAGTQSGPAGTQYAFTGWSDAGAATHSITVSASPATYTAAFKTRYQLTDSRSPLAGGTVTPASGTFYDAGSAVGVQAAANGGYQFANFSSGLTGSANPQTVTMNAPVTVVANFTPLTPNLAASLGSRVDGVPAGTVRLVTLNLTNTGLGAATNATITSITAILDVAGSGTVIATSGTPVDIGVIAPAAAGSGTVTFTWPATATRVRFTVNFSADGGYSGSTTITTVR